MIFSSYEKESIFRIPGGVVGMWLTGDGLGRWPHTVKGPENGVSAQPNRPSPQPIPSCEWLLNSNRQTKCKGQIDGWTDTRIVALRGIRGYSRPAAYWQFHAWLVKSRSWTSRQRLRCHCNFAETGSSGRSATTTATGTSVSRI